MAFTYGGDPSNSNREAVRFWCGDTDSSDQLLADAEIDYILTLESKVIQAAATACEMIASKFAREADTKNGALSVKASQRAAAYEKRASLLRSKTNREVEVFAGGLTVSGKDSLNESTTAVQPGFKTGQDDRIVLDEKNEYNRS